MKLKKWLLGLVTFTAMVVICAVCAGAETFGDYEYSVLDDGTVKITGYNGSAETVVIPDTIDGKSVTSIGNGAFEDCTSLTSVTIPDGVKCIGHVIPKHMHCLEQFPLNTSSKTDRKKIQELI